MSNAEQTPGSVREERPVLNYSLRHAKNIERKMMGEAFARLAPIFPLSQYRYVGFGSEFFNDFSLYHQMLGIRNMISIEHDETRLDRCRFNQPYKCIAVIPGSATEVLPQLDWSQRSIVWLDYVSKLDRSIVEDIRFVASQVLSGSMAVWTVNAQTWAGPIDIDAGEKIKESEWPRRRLDKLKNLFGSSRSFAGVSGATLGGWGLAALFHEIIVDEVRRALNDRNAAAEPAEQLEFLQCFHFRYSDGAKMLTVGGLFSNPADRAKLGPDPFSALDFVRADNNAFEIRPPTLTGREVRHLNKLLPHDGAAMPGIPWLSADQVETFRQLYRYYPIFAESEL
jgi:hypothetical protein